MDEIVLTSANRMRLLVASLYTAMLLLASAGYMSAEDSDSSTLDASQWFEVSSARDPFTPTCIDRLPSMDAPAGKHGFLRNVAGSFIFEDGVRGRMIGMMAPYLPENKADAAYIARYLAKYGINFVRIGHLVSAPSSYGDSRSAVDWTKEDSSTLQASAMDIMDYFISELAKNGVYSRLSMLWYRAVRKEDGIDDFDNLCKLQHNPKDKLGRPLARTGSITFFDPKVIALNIELSRRIMTHHNPYRDNRMWGEDPAICQIEIQNEDSPFFYSIDGLTDHYRQELDDLWNRWLMHRYGSRAVLANAWRTDLSDGEDPALGTVHRLKIWQFQQLGPAQQPRGGDENRFYCELANNYFNASKKALREAGVQQPICGSGWTGVASGYWAEIYSNVPGLDYTDRHYYYGGGGHSWEMVNSQKVSDANALKQPDLLLKLGLDRVIDRPFGISEWNCTLPDQWRLETAPIMVFYGSCLNGWDAPCQFSYCYGFWEGYGGFPRNMHNVCCSNDPSVICQYPALQLALKRDDITEGQPAFIKNMSDAKLFSGALTKELAIRYDQQLDDVANAHDLSDGERRALLSAGVGKVGISFTKEEVPDRGVDLTNYIDLNKQEIRSTTGELYWNYHTGYFTVNTRRTQAAVGFLQGISIDLADCSIVTDNRIASIILTSLDGQSIAQSKHMLLTAVGRTRNSGMYYNQAGTVLLSVGTGPMLQEGVRGTLTIKHGGTCRIVALSPSGYPTGDVTGQVNATSVVIPLDGKYKATYFEISFGL